MAKKRKKKFVVFSREAINNRLANFRHVRAKHIQNVENIHVILQKGNSKTGVYCYTVSLLPGIDCPNCVWEEGSCLYGGCYDIQNDCFIPSVINDRARNSAIHKANPERYWGEIEVSVRELCIMQLRVNVGGDLTNEDFFFVDELAERNPACHIMFFTKNHYGIAAFIKAKGGIENTRIYKNLHPLLSAWKGLKMYNPYNLPESHIMFPDGCTLDNFDLAYVCNGNCSRCFFHYMGCNKKESGCWGLEEGEKLVLPAH